MRSMPMRPNCSRRTASPICTYGRGRTIATSAGSIAISPPPTGRDPPPFQTHTTGRRLFTGPQPKELMRPSYRRAARRGEREMFQSKLLRLVGAVLTTCTCLVATNATAGEVLDNVMETGTLRMPSAGEWPPYAFTDESGVYTGFD